MSDQPRFHLAFPVIDLEATRAFFVDVLGASTGREDARWIDFDFFGHQISAHLCDKMPVITSNLVDDRQIPVSHFGLVMDWRQWQVTADRLRAMKVKFLVEPCIRFEGKVGEQATLFVLDPSGNSIELKAFRDPMQLFAR